MVYFTLSSGVQIAEPKKSNRNFNSPLETVNNPNLLIKRVKTRSPSQFNNKPKPFEQIKRKNKKQKKNYIETGVGKLTTNINHTHNWRRVTKRK